MPSKPYVKPVNKRRAAAAKAALLLPPLRDPVGRIVPRGWWLVPAVDQSVQIIRLASIDKVTIGDKSNEDRCMVWLRSGEAIAIRMTVGDALAHIALAEKAAAQ